MAKVLVNFPDDFLEEVDKVAETEHRTRSSLIREALRRYMAQISTAKELQEEQVDLTTQN